MLRWYYKIWTDAIVATRAKRTEAASWKVYTLVPMSALMGINLFTLFLWMKTLVNHNLPLALPANIFDFRLINGFIAIVMTFFITFVILNYLLIFNNDRFEQLVKKYPPKNGRLYQRYTLVSICILVIPVIISLMFF